MTKALFLFMLLYATTAPALGQPGREAGGQDILTRLMNRSGDGSFHLEVDSLLVANYYKLLNENQQIQGVPGFRIRIYSESGAGAKEEAQRVRARFISLYPEVDAYYDYDEPFFKVYVGDCRTRSEALKLYDRVEPNFPNPIMVDDHIQTEHPD